MLRFRPFFLLLLLLPGMQSSSLYAQDSRWHHFAPNDRILSMVEDGDDLWVHTLDGLVSFDMRDGTFDYFDKTNSQLGSEYIHGLARVGGGGTVVVVTYDLGVIEISGGTWTYHDSTNSPLPANDVISVSEDPHDGAWMITQSQPRLIRYDGQNWTLITVPDSGVVDPSQVVYVDHEAIVWVGTQSRLLSYDGVKWQDHSAELMAAGCLWLSVEYLYEDQQNRLWANIFGQLFRRDTTGTWQLIANGLDISNMEEDAMGEMWLTRNLGSSYQLMRYNELSETMLPVGTANSNIPFDAYASLYRAEEGSLWMGAYPGELTRYRNQSWQSFDLTNTQLKTRKTADITRDTEGNLFLLHEQIDWYDGTHWQHLSLPSGHGGDRMAVLNPNHLWLLDRSNVASTLSMYFYGQWTHYETGDFFPAGSQLKGLGLDGNGTLWVQEAHSFYQLAGNQWAHFDEQNSALPPGTAIAVSSAAPQGGIWWTDTTASHLYYFDGTTLLSYPNPFPGEAVPAHIQLHVGQNGDVWLYNDHRLQHFDGATFHTLPAYRSAEWQTINALSSQNDTLIVSSGYNVYFYQDSITEFTPYNSPLRTGWPGKVQCDDRGNFWITNLWGGKGGLTLYHPQGVQYSEHELTSALDPQKIASPYQLRAAPSQFSGSTDLLYSLPAAGRVRMDLYAINGRHMGQLLDAYQPEGTYRQPLSAEKMSPGVYLVRLQQHHRSETQKIVLLPD